MAVLFSYEIGGPNLADRMSINVIGHVMLPAQPQKDSGSGNLFSEEESVTLRRCANDSRPTSSTSIMSSDMPYVLTI